MRYNRFQNKVSSSYLTLPVCAVLVTLLWFLPVEPQQMVSHTVSWVITILTTYILMETNTINSLIRVRTRMVSVVWLAGIGIMSYLHTFSVTTIALLMMAGSYYILFGCYQQTDSVLNTFHSFTLLSIAIILVPQLVVMVPLYYWYLLIFMRSVTWRSFWAGILGLLLPVWFLVIGSFIVDRMDIVMERISELVTIQPLTSGNYTSLSAVQLINGAYVMLLSAVGIINYLVNYYDDKIRTRMILYIYVMQSVCVFVLILLQTRLYDVLLPVLWLNVCPLVAHFCALTGSRISNAFFCLILLLTVLVGYVNIDPMIYDFDSLLPWK